MSTKWLRWVLGCATAGFLVLLAVFLWLVRPAHITSMVEEGLARHLKMEASLERVEVELLPRPRVTGSGLSLRIPQRPDLPPFIAIDNFSMDIGLFSLMRKHVTTVYAAGLRIAVPPGDSRDALPKRDRDAEPSEILVRHFITTNAQLIFMRKDKEKEPLVFEIHDLHVQDVGFAREMPFTAVVTNPVPKGLVKVQGEIGRWNQEDGVQTPIEGRYTFENADLSTINGIGGTLKSAGQFSGALTAIAVSGDTEIPDFNLDLGGRPVPLTARFEAVVNGSDGTTILNSVDAIMIETRMSVRGAISNLEGPGNRDVDLHVEIEDGRIEDVLALVVDTPQPVMEGDVTVRARLQLPPGPGPVRNRLKITGEFGLAETRFTDDQVQAKLEGLSRRSQGKDKDDPIGRVLTDLHGEIALADGRARLTGLTFQVPGARVALNGSYGLATGTLDFHGTLRMKATVSEAVGGFKSIFIKPFNALFRKDGAGAVLPIKITGTREDPKFGLEMSKVF